MKSSRSRKSDAKSGRSASGKSSKSRKSSKSDKKSSRSRRSERSSMASDLLDEEFEGLISFSNLESVVRHIMARFKGFEDKTNNLDEKVRVMQVDLKSKATKQDLDLECNKLRVQQKEMEKSYDRMQEHVKELQ